MNIEFEYGPVKLKRWFDERDGRQWVRMEIGDDGVNVWGWPIDTNWDKKMSAAEELATMLSLIDGRFEVRRVK